MRILCLLMSVLFLTTSVEAARIDRASLVQFQLVEANRKCATVLPDGTSLEFHGLFANDTTLDNTVFHEILVVGIDTNKRFQFQSMVQASAYDEKFWAKVVKVENGRVFFAMDKQFLYFLWGSDATFEFKNKNSSPYVGSEYYTLYKDRKIAQQKITDMVICWEKELQP